MSSLSARQILARNEIIRARERDFAIRDARRSGYPVKRGRLRG